MAIAVGTNSTVSPRKAVSLTTMNVVGFNLADQVESKVVTKTPLGTSVPTAPSYTVTSGTTYSGSYTLNKIYTREIWITG
jgi:hypothetical protein